MQKWAQEHDKKAAEEKKKRKNNFERRYRERVHEQARLEASENEAAWMVAENVIP